MKLHVLERFIEAQFQQKIQTIHYFYSDLIVNVAP